jgi:hypothetical protein
MSVWENFSDYTIAIYRKEFILSLASIVRGALGSMMIRGDAKGTHGGLL